MHGETSGNGRADDVARRTPASTRSPRAGAHIEIDPTVDDRWTSLVATRRSDVFHSPAWLRVLARTYDLDLRARITLRANGEPVAGLVYARIDGTGPTRRVALPFSDFCDPLVDDAAQWEALAGDLLDTSGPLTVKVLFDEIAVRDPRLRQRARMAWHRADTSRDADALWAGLQPGARRAIRRSEAFGVRVRPAETLADVRSFHGLHLRLRKHKYRLLAQPWEFFEALWDHFLEPGHGVLLLACDAERVVGGVLYLQWNDTLYYKLNASDGDALQLRPNDAVLWAGLRHAHDAGLRWLDFGVSDLDQPGLLRYKRKYATQEGEVTSLERPTAGGPPDDPLRALLPQLTALLVRPDVPDEVTAEAGALLYRHFT